MVERSCGFGLAQETTSGSRVRDELGREELEGHLPAEVQVLRPVDHTHTAFAELLQDAVMGESPTDHGCLPGAYRYGVTSF
jgi:hypothetical protein